MGSRDTSKLDYLKQPHVAVMVIALIAVIALAIFTGSRRVNQNIKLSNMETFEACSNLVSDDNLCRFIASNEVNYNNPHVMTATETTGPLTKTSVTEIESATNSRTTSYSGDKETDASIVLGDTVYVKDYADSTWAFYKDPDYQQNEEPVKYDFTSENSSDVQELREGYKFETRENCGELSCYKYKIDSTEGTSDITYIWFDDEDFMPRRILTTNEESTINTTFEYKEVKIEIPSPTKEVKVEDIEQYLDS